MIAILNFTHAPLTADQQQQIVNSIVEQSDKRFIVQCPVCRVYECTRYRTPEATVEAVPLDSLQWTTWAVIPFTPDDAWGQAVLALVNRKRGYEWPVVRVVKQ